MNIVVDESRLLSSRERCPFLVRVEVAETGLQGNDGRLYAAGVHGLGATVEEALAMSAKTNGDSAVGSNGYAPYKIPSELLDLPQGAATRVKGVAVASGDNASDNHPRRLSPSGGWQNDKSYYPQVSTFDDHPSMGEVYHTGYGELHHQMYSEHDFNQMPHQPENSVAR